VKKADPHSGEMLISDTPGAELEALFDSARREGFSGVETEELWGRVGAALAAPGAAAPSHGTAAGGSAARAAGGASAALKLSIALVVGGSLVGGAMAYRNRAPAPVVAHVVRMETTVAPADPIAAAPAVAIDDLPRVSDPAPTAGARAKPSVDRREVARSTPGRVAEPHEFSAPAQDAVPASRTSSPAGGTTASEPPSADDHASASSPAQPDPSPTEGALLLRARQELSSDPSGAFALTQEHARRFPSGTLVQEREVLAIEALARLGRSSEARRRLDAFRARFPQSPHVARLSALVAP
jgi:hypothetical protein